MNITPATAHGRIGWLNPWRQNLADEESGSEPDRLAPREQAPWQPTTGDPALAYGCVDWYLYTKDTQSSDKRHAD